MVVSFPGHSKNPRSGLGMRLGLWEKREISSSSEPPFIPSINPLAAQLTARRPCGVPHSQHAPMHTGYTPLAFQVHGGERILCLDGGGIKGLIQIEVLIQIEELTGKRITDLFNWIVGTSTGGIIVLCMVYGKLA